MGLIDRPLSLLLRLLGQIVGRLGPALVTAAGVTILVGGLLTYDATAGVVPAPGPTTTPSAEATPTPLPTVPNGTPKPTSPPTGTASRVVLPALGIDLPVVAGPASFPYCNVAMYFTQYSQPGRPGTTYLFGHARVGMFLPLLTASQVNNGASLLGMLVEVYTSDARLYLYEIDFVKRHSHDFKLADNLPPGVTQQLVLQTSEGGRTAPKLDIRARFLYSQGADPRQANPKAHAIVCY